MGLISRVSSRTYRFFQQQCNSRKMSHFAQFSLKSDSKNETRVGYLNDNKDKLIDITNNYKSIESMLDSLDNLNLVPESESATQIDITDVNFQAPFLNPSKIVCVGKNYVEHALESGEGVPKEPVIFNKFPSSITSHNSHIHLPKVGATVDWEGELAVIIGKEGYNIKKEDALDYVAGYTVANDVSARDWQKKRNNGQWLIGKSFDTFCPIGPYFVLKSHISDIQNLNITTHVNKVLMQNSNTKNMAFPVDTIIEWVSQFSTLKVGDVILTGTPDGVGAWRSPPIFLKDGDVVEIEVENICKLENHVVDEK